MNLMVRLMFLFWCTVHPVHVSVTSIEYIREDSQFRGFVRIYLDDFLLDCKLYGYEINEEDLTSGRKEARETLGKYLNERLIVRVNETKLPVELKDVNISDNEINAYLVHKNRKEPGNVTVQSSIMTRLYNDQVNMVIVKVNDFEDGVKLTPELTEQTFIIN